MIKTKHINLILMMLMFAFIYAMASAGFDLSSNKNFVLYGLAHLGFLVFLQLAKHILLQKLKTQE